MSGMKSSAHLNELMLLEKGTSAPEDTHLGWEGAPLLDGETISSDGSKEEDGEDDGGWGGEHDKAGLAVCLCFEGGPGTIGTVKVRGRAARGGTGRLGGTVDARGGGHRSIYLHGAYGFESALMKGLDSRGLL